MAEKKIDYFPKDEREEFFSFIETQIDKAPVVKNYHGKWQELTVWADDGEQYSEYDVKLGQMKPVSLRKRKVKIVINLMKPLKEAIEGKLNLIYQLAGVPNSGEAKDIAGSRVSTKLMTHNDYVNDVEAVFADFADDLLNTGNAFISKQWLEDEAYYGEIPILPEGATIKEGRVIDGKVGKHKKVPGEVVVYTPSVYNCRPDTAGKKRKNWRWFIEIKEVPISVVLDNFPKLKKDDVIEAAMGKESDDEKFRGVSEKKKDRPEKEGIREEDKTVMVSYYWEKKSSRFKEGRLIITIGQLVLSVGPNPALGEIPFWHFGYKKSGKSMWHTGPMHHVQDIQRAFNRFCSIIAEHLEGWKPKLAITPNSFTKKGAFTTDALEIVEIDEAANIKVIPTPELSAAVTAFRDFLQSSFNVVSNIHEVSYSQLPKYASRAPASLFSMMLEEESAKIAPMIKQFNRNIKEMGTFGLRLMDKYYENSRMIKVVGEGEKSAIEYFKGADIAGNYDVKVVQGVSLHQSKSIQQRMLIELKQAGAPFDWNRIIKLLGMGDVGQELRSDVADEARAERENQAFINDDYDKDYNEGGVEIYFHDDHAKHLDTHTELRKGEEAQSWDEKKLADLDQHIEHHWLMVLFGPQIVQAMMKETGKNLGQLGMSDFKGVGIPSAEGGMGDENIPTSGLPSEGQVTPETATMNQETMI